MTPEQDYHNSESMLQTKTSEHTDTQFQTNEINFQNYIPRRDTPDNCARLGIWGSCLFRLGQQTSMWNDTSHTVLSTSAKLRAQWIIPGSTVGLFGVFTVLNTSCPS